jgi:hypothetical protein
MRCMGLLLTAVGLVANTIGSAPVTPAEPHRTPKSVQERFEKLNEKISRELKKAALSPIEWRKWQHRHIPGELVLGGIGTFTRTSDNIDLTKFPPQEITYGCECHATKQTKILVTPLATYIRSR